MQVPSSSDYGYPLYSHGYEAIQDASKLIYVKIEVDFVFALAPAEDVRDSSSEAA
jgi:hypothetical protein